jgi:hypothetical protein
MAMNSRLLAPAAVLLLGACDTIYPASRSIDPGFGEAVKYSTAIQVIDPDPVYTADGAQPGDHGEKGAEAVKRYRTDKVKAVSAQTTTSSGGGGPN